MNLLDISRKTSRIVYFKDEFIKLNPSLGLDCESVFQLKVYRDKTLCCTKPGQPVQL